MLRVHSGKLDHVIKTIVCIHGNTTLYKVYHLVAALLFTNIETRVDDLCDKFTLKGRNGKVALLAVAFRSSTLKERRSGRLFVLPSFAGC